METALATLLLAEPNTTWVNATLFMGGLELAGPAKLGNGRSVSNFLAALRVFCSRGVLLLPHPEKAGSDEVKQ